MGFNPDEPRDERGRWTVGGAAGGHDDRVLDVGGDKWNQETAARLEKEYDDQRGALDKMAHEAAEHSVEIPGGDVSPASWDGLSGSTQESASEKYVDQNLSSEVDHEIDNWHENGGSLHDAAHALASDDDWKHEALADFIKDRTENEEPRIPYSVEQLADAIKIGSPDYDGYKDDQKKPDIEFDDSKLQQPDNHLSPDQFGLPGIETPKPEESLTEKMREDLTNFLGDKFYEDAKDKSSGVEAPDYLEESAKESLESNWGEMSDDDKYEWTKSNTDLIDEDSSSSGESGNVAWPDKWDPLGESEGEDYRNTQRMARYLQTERAAQLLGERDLYTNISKEDISDAIVNANREMWEGWKSASTGADGKMIQVAAHEELGGRLNTTSRGVSVTEAHEYADSNYKAVGGYEGVKALIRATWETSQYMLDRADQPTVSVYRGIKLDDLKAVGTGDGVKYYSGGGLKDVASEKVQAPSKYGDTTEYHKLPDLHIARNGASSWTTDAEVANNWSGGSGQKVTLRAEVPRTSVLSLPAYGVNIHSEHEVVVMGTAWKHWDAWANRAPKFNDVAIKPHVAKAPKHKITQAEKEHVVT